MSRRRRMLVIAALFLVVLGASVLGLRTSGGGPRIGHRVLPELRLARHQYLSERAAPRRPSHSPRPRVIECRGRDEVKEAIEDATDSVSAAVIGGVVVAVRVLAPKLHTRMLAACKGMFEQMPEDFPPKRMMGGIEEIRANTTRILELLEERTQVEETKPQAEPPPLDGNASGASRPPAPARSASSRGSSS